MNPDSRHWRRIRPQLLVLRGTAVRGHPDGQAALDILVGNHLFFLGIVEGNHSGQKATANNRPQNQITILEIRIIKIIRLD